MVAAAQDPGEPVNILDGIEKTEGNPDAAAPRRPADLVVDEIGQPLVGRKVEHIDVRAMLPRPWSDEADAEIVEMLDQPVAEIEDVPVDRVPADALDPPPRGR